MKNMFSLVSTYINWSSLSLPTPRIRKANESRMVSAAHPLVKRRSCRLFRFSSCRYITKGEIFTRRPLLRNDRRYPRGGASIPEVKFGVSEEPDQRKPALRIESVSVGPGPTTCQLCFLLACMCVLITSHRTASVMMVSTRLALPRH